MKRKMIVAAFLTIVGSLAAQTQQWFEVASGTDKKLNVIDFPSANVGYIGGNDSLLLKTIDGGRNWNLVNYSGVTYYPEGEDIVNLKFVNDLVGFMTVGPYSGTYKTIDGGTSWTLIESLAMCFNQGLFFFDENNGFIGGSGCFQGEMIERLSGGVWEFTTINTPTSGAQNLIVDIDFLDANFGLAASNSGYILRTIDGGLSWDTIPSPGGIASPITSVLVISSMVALATYVSEGGQGLYITTDGGLSWQYDMNSATFFYPGFNCSHQSENGRVFAGGSPESSSVGLIFESSEDLSIWSYSNSPIDHTINSIDGYADSIVFAVGDSGYIVTNVNPLTLSLNENFIEINEVVLYPNPTSSTLNISSSMVLTEENAQINIISLKGEIVSQMKFNSTIDLSVLQSGIYFLEIKTEKELFRKKIIKD